MQVIEVLECCSYLHLAMDNSIQFVILKSEFGRSQLTSLDGGCLDICCVNSSLRFREFSVQSS